MAANEGLYVADTITTPDGNDQFATHSQDTNKGGFRSVQTVAQMNAITAGRRIDGMEVRVVNDGTPANNGRYVLQPDLTTWTKETGGGGGHDISEDVIGIGGVGGVGIVDSTWSIMGDVITPPLAGDIGSTANRVRYVYSERVDAEVGYYVDENLFIHAGSDIDDDSVFIGNGAGNLTSTAGNVTGTGVNCLASIVSGSQGITGYGTNCLSAITVESRSAAFGNNTARYFTEYDLTAFGYNVASGPNFAGRDNIFMGNNLMIHSGLTTARRNIWIAMDGSYKLTTGENMTVTGYKAGATIENDQSISLYGALTDVAVSGLSNSSGFGSNVIITASHQIVMGRTLLVPQSFHFGGVQDGSSSRLNETNTLYLNASATAGIADLSAPGISVIAGPSGNGLGLGGSILFRVAPPALATNTTRNAHINALGIDQQANVVFYNGGLDPTTTANQFKMWSKDIVAGNAAPHFITELGDIIKLYKQTLIADPSGGATVDSESRTAINAILDLIENTGLMASV